MGNILKLTSFGESHGAGIGVVIDGFPAGVEVNHQLIHTYLQRRKPGQSGLTTARKEDEEFQIQSGVFEGITTGHPIAVWIPNTGQKSKDYNHLKAVYRPSHADFTYDKKYGIRDYNGGGRASARITAGWVIAGAFGQMLLEKNTEVKVLSFVKSIHRIEAKIPEKLSSESIEASPVRCPDQLASQKMERLISEIKTKGDSVGGVIETRILNPHTGWGDPVFEKLNARIAHAMLNINAVKGIQFGSGFDIAKMYGSEANDLFYTDRNQIRTNTNHSGGIQGGISNGMPIHFQLAFKPTASISSPQKTTNKDNSNIVLETRGRHDPCVLPRAIPIVEALTYFILADSYLMNKTARI